MMKNFPLTNTMTVRKGTARDGWITYVSRNQKEIDKMLSELKNEVDSEQS